MKLIIAGTRTLMVTNEQIQEYVLRFNLQPSVILCGLAQGIDTCGSAYATFKGISCHGYPAEWKKFGPRAGPIRNQRMAKDGDELLLIWDGRSPGSKNMKLEMSKLQKPIHEVII
jgi:hypothetical protein